MHTGSCPGCKAKMACTLNVAISIMSDTDTEPETDWENEMKENTVNQSVMKEKQTTVRIV